MFSACSVKATTTPSVFYYMLHSQRFRVSTYHDRYLPISLDFNVLHNSFDRQSPWGEPRAKGRGHDEYQPLVSKSRIRQSRVTKKYLPQCLPLAPVHHHPIRHDPMMDCKRECTRAQYVKCTRNFLTFVNTTAIAYGQKNDQSLRILVACNSSRVYKRQKITSTAI